MWHLKGILLESGEIYWDLQKGSGVDTVPGLRISFNTSSFGKRTPKVQAIQLLKESFAQSERDWLRQGAKEWIVDGEALKTIVPELAEQSWFTGTHSQEPTFVEEEEVALGEMQFTASLVLSFSPDGLAKPSDAGNTVTNKNARGLFFQRILYKGFIEFPQQKDTFLRTTLYKVMHHVHWELTQQYAPLLPFEKPLQGCMSGKAFLHFLSRGFQLPGNERHDPQDLQFNKISDRDPGAFTCLKVIQAELTRFTDDWIGKLETLSTRLKFSPALLGSQGGFSEEFVRFFSDTASGRLILLFLDGGFKATFERWDEAGYLEILKRSGLGREISENGMKPGQGEFPVPTMPWDEIRVFFKAGVFNLHRLFGNEAAEELKKTEY